MHIPQELFFTKLLGWLSRGSLAIHVDYGIEILPTTA
jgi:hypothetical protein